MNLFTKCSHRIISSIIDNYRQVPIDHTGKQIERALNEFLEDEKESALQWTSRFSVREEVVPELIQIESEFQVLRNFD